MPESIEGPYLNMPPGQVKRVSESKRSKESHDNKNPFPKLKRKDSEDEQENHKGDSFDKEAKEEDQDTKALVVHKNGVPANGEGPGLVIDVTV